MRSLLDVIGNEVVRLVQALLDEVLSLHLFFKIICICSFSYKKVTFFFLTIMNKIVFRYEAQTLKQETKLLQQQQPYAKSGFVSVNDSQDFFGHTSHFILGKVFYFLLPDAPSLGID